MLMPIVGVHASHEQFAPSALLRYVRLSEAAGFRSAMCSDHFHPWSERQGQSGFSWAWLGAALQATGMSFGVVCAPGQRYHPAIIAQASATLAEMFPGRFWLALGSGVAVNERITGNTWPPKLTRNARLRESVDVIRRLWRGETVDHEGLVRVRSARLYTRPALPPPVMGAALSPDTAQWMGEWADGLITAGASREALRAVVEAFQRGGGRGKRLVLQAAISYAPRDDEALAAAFDQWRHAVLDPVQLADLETPEAFDAATRTADPQQLRDRLHISADVGEHISWLKDALALGFDEIYLHHVGRELARFIDVFGRLVVPALDRGGRGAPPAGSAPAVDVDEAAASEQAMPRPMLRKQIGAEESGPTQHGEEKDIAVLARVLVTSEDPSHPIELAFDSQRGMGASRWVAGRPGDQTILLIFDRPQSIRKVRLEIEETDVSRTQELALSVSDDAGATYRHIVRQEYNFNPPGTVIEREEWAVTADGVTHLRLMIKPDKAGTPCRATLTSFAVE
jgi:coenzyme F420-dependent glucose-6-phosphate dehydrogenase